VRRPQLRESLSERGTISIPVNAALIATASLILFLLPNVAVAVALGLLAAALGFMVLFVGILFDRGVPLTRIQLSLAAALVLSCLSLCFAGVYYSQSQTEPGAFSKSLNRQTALYFAIGTMSSSGTNGGQAKSRSAEAELAAQEVVDLTALALLLAGVAKQLGARPRRPDVSQRAQRPVTLEGTASHTPLHAPPPRPQSTTAPRSAQRSRAPAASHADPE
jgi:hypothetical protein